MTSPTRSPIPTASGSATRSPRAAEHGYDHKAMGITARGAWESIRRHARALGKDADHDELTVVGIGDMSGDVFGNGMLRSEHIKLVAAFDHRHIFIDPDPDPAVSFAERKRLFDLPRSSWANYDTTLLSAGGGVYPRTLKTIAISPEARKRLGTDKISFTPNELLSTILRAPVDVLWNGGIGTYVKASTESHAEVGDRANDGLRVNGSDLRCKMVGEGGNLGLTQRGRIEFALNGGLVNTDAIDNSAGVDCSDHEVNIKILLGAVMAEGKMTFEQRNELLAEMTDEVAELVLDDNRSQTLTLAIARHQAVPMVNVHARYLHVLESEGWLNRGLEYLPTDKQIADRQSAGFGLTTPEFAIVLAYTKSVNVTEMVRTQFPDDPYLEPDLVRYFPTQLQKKYRPEILDHRLRRELIATQIANEMVNLSGISFDNRMTEDTGAGVVDVMRAWVAARDIFSFPTMWEQIEALPTHVKLETQLGIFLDARRMVERGALWLLRHRRPPIEIGTVVGEFQPGIAELSKTLETHLRGKMRDRLFANEAARLAAGVPEKVAERSVLWPLMHTAFDIIDLANRQHLTVHETAAAYWEVFELLDLDWLWDAVGMLPRNDRWQTQARSRIARRPDEWSRRPGRRRVVRRRCPCVGRRQRAGRRSGAWRCSPRSAAPMRTTSPRCRWPCGSCATLRSSPSVHRPRNPALPTPVAWTAHEQWTSIQIRAIADRFLPRRRGAHRALQLGTRQAARGHVRAADRGHRRGPQPAGVDAGDHRRLGVDRHPRRRSGVRRAVLPEPIRRRPSCSGAAAVRGRRGVLLRPHLRADPRARQGHRSKRLRRILTRSRAGPWSRSSASVSSSRGIDDGARSRARRRGVRSLDDRGLRAAARQRHADVPARQCGRRHRDANLARGPRRGAPSQHAEAAAAVGGDGPAAAGVGARAAVGQRAAQEVVEAARQGCGRAVPGRGVPARGDDQLLDDARMVAAR